MRKLLYLMLVLCVGVAGVHAQERITLATPDAVPTNVNYRLDRMVLQWDDPSTAADEGHITIQLLGVERPTSVICVYSDTTTPTGTALLVGLNKANLSSAYAGTAGTGSLIQRIFYRLVVLNEAPTVCGRSLVGSLTGSPQ